MSKYNALWESVRRRGGQSLLLTFDEIRDIAGIPIDHSFLTHKKELTAYGYRVERISLKMQTVAFHRTDSGIQLLPPSAAYGDQVMAYKAEMLANNDSLDGCAGLEDVDIYDQWLRFEERLSKKFGDGYVPSEVFLAVRAWDDRLVGVIDYRRPLSDFLFRFGGNIGYSVRPSERGRGYANEMLGLLLCRCRELNETKVLLTCDKANAASAKTIVANGGVLENEIDDPVGLSASGVIQRYWITLG